MGFILFALSSLLTTALTLFSLFALYLLISYVVGAAILTYTAFKYGLKRWVWLNPIRLCRYSGTSVTITMASGDLTINYFGHFPKVRFIPDR